MKYNYPLPKNIKIEIAHPVGDYAHENFIESKYAVDFLVDIGTLVLAARDGKVLKIKDDSDKWGLDRNLAQEVNFVIIDHGDRTYSEYLHLGKNKVLVKEGQQVKIGNLLGYTGLSGCMDTPHLHFNLFRVENGKGVSTPVEWNN